MSEDALSFNNRRAIGWYEVSIPIRGCHFSLQNIKDVYRDIYSINKRFGEELISRLHPEAGLTDEQWKERKSFLLQDAFQLTVTINGARDEKLYGESVDVFDDPNLPRPIKSIYFTNATAFRRNSGGNDPVNRVAVFLDFGKPEVFDPNPLVSAATPNNGCVDIDAQDITFFNAIQNAVEKKLLSHRTWYGAIHRNFAYDIGMWLIALPVSLYFSAYQMDKLLPEGSDLALFRWPLFLYFVGLAIILYRAMTAYAKWAFPVNVLDENKDRALKHRLALGAFVTWVFFEVASTVPSLIAG